MIKDNQPKEETQRVRSERLSDLQLPYPQDVSPSWLTAVRHPPASCPELLLGFHDVALMD